MIDLMNTRYREETGRIPGPVIFMELIKMPVFLADLKTHESVQYSTCFVNSLA